jgi:uncharacterized protein with HEPN domain
MNEADRIRLEHILEAIQDIEIFVGSMKREEFIWNKLVRSAVVRQLEIIGEAAGSVSDELRSKYPKIPWRIIKDFRNVLAHHYFGIDYNEVYTVLELELPKLKKDINEILINFNGSDDI